MNESINERNQVKKIFSNNTSRLLLGIWALTKGSRFSMETLGSLLSLPEDTLEAKLQVFAGIGLVSVTTDSTGERQVDFLPSPSMDIEKITEELYEGRKNEFEAVEKKLRSTIYKILLTQSL